LKATASCTLLIVSLLLFSTLLPGAYASGNGQPNPKIEYHFGFVGPGIVEGEITASAFAPHLDLGFKWDRPHPGPFVWDKIEPVKGLYDFSETDQYVQAAQQYGIQVMATIWPYAEWDQEYWRQQPDWQPSQGFEEFLPESRYKPHDMEAYKAFVRALVERYDGDGIDDMPGLQQPIKYWEVLNEPEMGLKGEPLNFFHGSPADYLEIVKATYEAVKEADPEAKVLNGGIAYVPETLSEWNSFWGEFFSLGGGQYIDIITFHNLNPHVSTALAKLKEYLEAYDIDKPIWLTELQVAEGYDPQLGLIGEEEQAELLVKGCIEGFAGGIDKIFYTAYIENPQVPENLSKAALLKADGTPKKAYYAYKTMVVLLEGFTSVEKLEEDVYKFTCSDGLEVYAVYPEATPPALTGKILTVNLEGETRLLDAGSLQPPTNLTYIVVGSEEELEKVQEKLREALGKTSEETEASTIAGEIEVKVQKLSHFITFPWEQSYKFTIPVKNLGQGKVHLHPRISGVPEEWICIGGGDLILEPGEEGNIVYAFTIFPGVKTTKATIIVTIENLTHPDSPPASVTLEVGFMEVMPPPTSKITGKIVDKVSGKPVANAEVRAFYWSNLDCASTVSGPDGSFRMAVPSSSVLELAYRDLDLRGEPLFHLEVSAEGYEHYSLYDVRVPPEGLNLKIELTPVSCEGFYQQVWAESVEGYGIWKCIPTEDWSLFAVCQGEHGFPGITVPPETTNIYLFDGSGSLLWKRSIEKESWAVDIAFDGSKIASGSHGGKVYVWDRDGNLLWTVDVGPEPVREVKFSHNGKYLAFGPTPEGRGYVGLYDAETGKLLWSYETGDHVREIEFTVDDRYVAVSSTDGYTYLFTIDGKLLWKRYHGGYLPFMLKISENNDMLVVAGKGQELYAYDFNGNLLWSFEAPEVIQYGAASSDLSRILIFSNSALYMLDREGKVVWWKKISPIGHNAIAMTPDGKYIAVGCMDVLCLLNENGTTIWKFKGFEKGSGFHAKHPFLCAAQNVQISPDAAKILAGFGETNRKLRLFQGEIKSVEKPEAEQPRKIRKADLDGDGKVSREDLEVLKKVYGLMFGVAGFKPEADLNGDNKIDIVDLAILAFQCGREKPSLPAGDVIPAKGPGIPPKGLENEDGPWNHRLLLAKSTDGVKWTKSFQILADQASVPDVIVDHEGNLRVYYADYFNLGITVAISPDGGETWIYRKVKGLTPEWVDPDVVLLPDGRYRLYASYMPLEGPQDKIVSAISEDGINFTPEEGYRYHEPESLLTDPDVFWFKDRWYMIIGPELTLLESEDGLIFKKVEKLPFGCGVSCTIPYGEGLRVYFHLDEPGPLKIYLSYTEDLKTWSKPEVVLAGGENSLDQYGVGDPAVAKLPEGGYIMVYKTWIQKPKQGGEMETFEGRLESKAEEEKFAEKFYRFGIGAKMGEVSTARLAHLLGLDWIRLDSVFIWGEIEPSKGEYNFEKSDEVVRKIQEYDVRVIAKITSFAEWDFKQKYPEKQLESLPRTTAHIPSPPPYKPYDIEAYKDFVRKVVERYDGDGIEDMPGLKYPIKCWTILNEPEDHEQFIGTGKDYAEILKASYEAIKEADPEAKVNIAAAGDVGVVVLGSNFWEEALKYSKGYFDYGNIHYNVGASGIDKEGFEDLSRGFRVYRDYLSSFGIRNVKVWGTEISLAPGSLPVEEKARLWVIGTVKSFANGAIGLKYPFVFSEEKDERMLRMFLTLTTLLKNFDRVEKVGEGCYRFYADGSEIFVAWKPGKLPDDLTGETYVVDVYGNIEKKDASSITLTSMPLFILKDEGRIEALKSKLQNVGKLIEELQEISKPESGEGGPKAEKGEEAPQPLTGGEDISWENAQVFQDPEGDFWLGGGSPPEVISFPPSDILAVYIKTEGEYLYIKYEVAGEIPRLPLQHNGDTVRLLMFDCAVDTDWNLSTGEVMNYQGADLALEAWFGSPKEAEGEMYAYIHHAFYDPKGEEGISQWRPGEIVAGGLGEKYVTMRFKLSEIGLSKGMKVRMLLWVEAESDLYHHFARDVCPGEKQWVTVEI